MIAAPSPEPSRLETADGDRGNRVSVVGVRTVSKGFGVVQALEDVSLVIRPGEILALVGENGAGKSTLVRILEGVHQPDRGSLEIGGVPRTFRSPGDAHAYGIRVIHQEPDIIPDLSIAENLFLGDFRRVNGIFLDRRDLAQRTRKILSAFGLEDELWPWTRAGNLGPAQRQLMEIMRALRSGVSLLALDEPTSSLTEDETQRLFGIVRQLRRDGVAIVYITHRMREVMALADRITVLRDGRLVAERATSEVTEDEIVQLMVGRPITELFDRSARNLGPVVLSVRGLTTGRVKDVNLEIRAGEVVGLAGLVGAGTVGIGRGDLWPRAGKHGHGRGGWTERFGCAALPTRSPPASASLRKIASRKHCCCCAASSTISRSASPTSLPGSTSSTTLASETWRAPWSTGCAFVPQASISSSPSSRAAISRR